MSIARKSLFGALIISAVAIFATAIVLSVLSLNTAESVIQEQSKQRLISLREVQKEELELYLERIHQQVLTMSDGLTVRSAASAFIRAFDSFSSKQELSADEMRAALRDYYSNEFGALYEEKNSGASLSAESLLAGISDEAVAMQYHFIQQNPNPLGSKDALNTLAEGSVYSSVHGKYHPDFRRYLQAFAYYDIFLIDAQTGHIVYSVFKELDFGTSLLTGPYKDSGLAEAFKGVRYATNVDAISYVPFKSYTPSYEDPAAFIASPIQNSSGKTIAVLAFQMPIDELNNTMTHGRRWSEKGLGMSGETYLVGENYKAQSISRFLIEDKEAYLEALKDSGETEDLIRTIAEKETNIGFQTIRTEGVEAAIAGESGYGIFPDYRNVSVLSAYAPVKFEGSTIALMVEIDEAEAFAFQSQMRNESILATIIVSLLALAGVGFIVWRYTESLSVQLNDAVDVADAVSKGETAVISGTEKQDEVGALMRALERMQTELIGELERREKEATRVKMALDVCDTSVMIADPDYEIIYMNESMTDTMVVAEDDLRTDLPSFEARNLMHQNIDVFHKQPGHQRNLLDNLTEVFRTQIVVGGRTFSLVATPIMTENNERLGTVVEWEDLTDKLAREEEENKVAANNARIKTALDTVSANVMMADADRKIIYANKAVIETLRKAQNDIRTELPHFDVDKLLGGSVDQFHVNPQHQKSMLEKLQGEHKTRIEVGGRTMDLTVNPVNDAQGQRIGSVVEWADRTAEVAIQKEMDGIIAAANDGNLKARISLDDKEGAFLSLSEGLNTLLNKVSAFVADMGEVFEAMSEGDLSKNIDREYRGEFETIKSNANNSIAKLTQVMRKIQGASSAVRTSANEVAQGSDDLSRRTESQASSLEETASSMEEITATVKQTSDNAAHANELADTAKDKAEQGGHVVEDAVKAMAEILDSSNKINDIISVIDEIAFQTNLLALNAAVEAARAGEQGRGFAVVAGEVRTLSQRSAAAAKEIKDLIRDSVGKVESGSQLVNQSGETLSEIVGSVEKVAEMIRDVANAAREQNSGISQINQAITQMDEMTQQNAALVEETSAASRSMSEEATSMASLVSFFRLGSTSAMIGNAAPSADPVRTYQGAGQGNAPKDPDDPVSNYIDDIYS